MEERFGPRCLRIEGARAIGYVLPSVLEIGWRIVTTTPAERIIQPARRGADSRVSQRKPDHYRRCNLVALKKRPGENHRA